MKNRRKSLHPVLKASLTVIGFLLFLGVIAGGYYYFYIEDSPPDVAGLPVDIYFLPTEGEADCTLLKQGEVAVLIDTGEARDGEAVVAFLKDKGVETITLLILSHPDQDHIGGAPAVAENFDITRVIAPRYTKEHAEYEALQLLLIEKGVPVINPVLSRNFNAGEMTVTVYPPYESNYNKDNNYSLAALVSHEDINLLFTGDAEQKRLLELLEVHWPPVDLFKVPRHGRASTSSGDYIRQVAPSVAVVTAADADSAVKDALNEVGAEVYYTAGGLLHFRSDGETLRLVA